MSCNCRARARFDADGNLVTLYTCKSCLRQALENLRKSICNLAPCMVQLLLVEEDGQLRLPKAANVPEGRMGRPSANEEF